MKKYIVYYIILLNCISYVHAWSLVDSFFDSFSSFVSKIKKVKKVTQQNTSGVQIVQPNEHTVTMDFNVTAIPAGTCYETEVFADQMITISFNSLIFSELYKSASIYFGKELPHIRNNTTSKSFFAPYYAGGMFGIEFIESMLPSKKSSSLNSRFIRFTITTGRSVVTPKLPTLHVNKKSDTIKRFAPKPGQSITVTMPFNYHDFATDYDYFYEYRVINKLPTHSPDLIVSKKANAQNRTHTYTFQVPKITSPMRYDIDFFITMINDHAERFPEKIDSLRIMVNI